MIALTWPQVLAFRLTRHHLAKRAPRSRLTQVVGDVCGIHAQLMSAAELAIWARVDGITRDEIQAALWERRSLVKTWCMRGTLHLLPATEYPTYVSALRTRTRHRRPAWLKRIGLTLSEMEGIIKGIRAALDGRTLTRDVLASVIGRQLGPHVKRRLLWGWGSLLKPAAYQGYLCFGPSRGQNVTFVRPDQWLGTRRRLDDLDSDATLEAIGRRYLGAYGPATYRDFATWWGGGTGRGQAKRMMRSLASEIVEVSIEGKPGWMLAKDATQAKKAAAVETVRLLPHFDGYTLHFRPREHLVPTRFAARIFRNQGWISPVLLINGMAAGTWELARTGRNVEVRLQPFAPLRPAFLRKIREEVDHLAHFLGGRVRVTD